MKKIFQVKPEDYGFPSKVLLIMIFRLEEWPSKLFLGKISLPNLLKILGSWPIPIGILIGHWQ